MDMPLLCLLLAFILTHATKLPVALAMARQPGGYDNRHPRQQQTLLDGWGRRALAAHQNAFEAFPGFAAGVLVAELTGAAPAWASRLAVAFLVCRLAYTGLYLADVAAVRSLVWTIGLAATIGLLALPLIG
jgi:uncharacterized MAPEG superfamily protein